MFLTEKNKVLDNNTILEIIKQFQTRKLPRMAKWARYYEGNHDINRKEYSDSAKPCNKITTNFCSTIADNYLGYITGKPISYETGNSEVMDILRYNDYQEADKELLRNALVFGYGAELSWIDEDGMVRFTVLDSREVVPIYYNSIDKDDLACVIRIYPAENISLNPKWNVELYFADRTVYYKADSGLNSLEYIDERPNFYNQIPVVIMPLNEAWECVFNQVIGLNDAYNQILSGEIDDYDSFADAYMVFKGATYLDSEDLEDMKRNRAIVLDENSDVDYLTKKISDVQTENILENIKRNIYLVSNCVDFSDEAFGTSSGIAMKMKLLGMENYSGTIERHMTKALQKRIELICSILSKTSGEEVWRDVDIVFTRNIPNDFKDEVSTIMALRGLVSDKTLLSQLSFIKDVDEELARLKVEKEENLSLYEF